MYYTTLYMNAPNLDLKRFELALRQRVHRKRLCILIIDPQSLSRQMAIEVLSHDYEVVTCASSEQALHYYLHHAPDIVFLDIDNPGMNGLDILEHIAVLDAEAYVILLTARERPDHHRLRKCVQGHVVKPFTRKKLAQHLYGFGLAYPNRGTRLA